jgi:hypothetical protein
MNNFFMKNTGNTDHSDYFFKGESGMEAICPRCSGKGNLYSKSSFMKIALSGEEKDFIFRMHSQLCTYCIMQMKTRYSINLHFHPYKKQDD